MKKTLKHILALVIILPFLFAGCEKTELVNETDESAKSGILKSGDEYCGDAKTVNLVSYANQTFNPGTVTVGNDADYLYVTYNTTSPMTEIRLYVGQHDPDPNPYFDEVLPGNVVHYYKKNFPYQDDGPATTKMFTIPLNELVSDDGCFMIISHALVDGQFVTGAEGFKSYGWYFDYCLEECEPPPPLGECETAFAYGDQYAYCFRDFNKKNGQYNPGGNPKKNFSRWGWTNGELEEGNTYSFDIWAGAGQCDLSKGTLVGDLTVDYYGSTVTVTYNMMNGYVMDETHLYIGEDPIPMKSNNKPTLAPGQYPYSDDDATTVEDNLVTYEINNITGEIYVIAHSVVCDDE